MTYPSNNRTIMITIALILTTNAVCLAQIQQPPKVNTINKQINNPVLKSADDDIQSIINYSKRIKVDFARPVKGKDLKLVINNVADNSTESQNKYSIQYSLINNGTEDIDITGIAMQGKFSDGQVAGGMSLTALFITNALNANPVLQPGEALQSVINVSNNTLYNNGGPYKYILKADDDNIIPEANENNNTAEVSITAHIPPPASPDPSLPPDLIISDLSVNYTNMVNINYTIKNIGQGIIDLKKISVEGEILSAGAGCGGSVYTLGTPKSLAPGESYSRSFSCTKNLTSGQQYVYKLTVSSTYSVPESNTNNNTASVQFTKP